MISPPLLVLSEGKDAMSTSALFKISKGRRFGVTGAPRRATRRGWATDREGERGGTKKWKPTTQMGETHYAAPPRKKRRGSQTSNVIWSHSNHVKNCIHIPREVIGPLAYRGCVERSPWTFLGFCSFVNLVWNWYISPHLQMWRAVHTNLKI